MTTMQLWPPRRDLETMERRVLRLLDGMIVPPVVLPAADIYETGEEYVVELEVPGFEEKELDVEVADHTLVVRGERKAETETHEKTVLLRERLELDFERRFALPATADNEHVSADFATGVLTLHVPKVAEAKPHKVAIAKK